MLNVQAPVINRIKDRRQIVQQRKKYFIQVSGISEKHIHCGQDQTDADIEHSKSNNRYDQRKERHRERDAICPHENKEDHQSKQKIDKGRNILGEYK